MSARFAAARHSSSPAPARLLVAFVSVTLLLAIAGVLASPSPALGASRRTIVLVHGAWAGPGGWDRVTAALAKDGYRTVVPTLGLQDPATDVATVRSALDAIVGPKILVGHSYGGAVVSQAAAGRGDVVGIVYTAAFVPDEGESLLTLGAGYAPPAALAHLVWTGAPFASLSTIDPAFFGQDFAQDLNPSAASALATAQIPTSFAIFAIPAGPVAWHAVLTWYAVSGEDRMIDPALQRFMAARANATTVTFDEASHAGGYTHYATRLVKLIEEAASAR